MRVDERAYHIEDTLQGKGFDRSSSARTPEACESSELLRHYRELFELAPDAYLVTDATGIIRDANRAALLLLGDPGPSLAGARLAAFVAEADCPCFQAALDVMIEEGNSSDGHVSVRPLEIRLVRCDGTTFDASVSASASRDAAGASVVRWLVRDVSESRRAEAALSHSEAYLRAIFERAPVGIAIGDVGGRYLHVNQACQKLLGYSQVELQDLSFDQITHPDDLPTDVAQFKQVETGALESYSFEKRYICKDGSLLWAHVAISLVRDEQGHPQLAIKMVEDITARRVAEEALRQSKEQLEIILAGVADGITVQDRTGRIIYANPAAARVSGYPTVESYLETSPDEILQRFEVLDAAGNPLPREQLPGRQALRGQTSPAMTVGYRNRDTGEERWAVVRASPVFDECGQVLLAINIFQDITEARKAELALRESQERFTAFMDASDAIAFMKDSDGHYVYVNPAVQRQLGRTPAELLGRTDFDIWPPEVAEALRQNDRQVLSSGKTLETIEPVLAANGDLQYAAVTKFPFTDSSGRLYLGGMAINITQWKHAEAALRQSEERHRALVAAIPDLIFRLDRHGRFLDYEPGRGLEADPRDFLGKTVDELFDSELAGRTRLVIERALHDGEIHTFESPLPLNGGQREWEARLVADGNGEVLAVVRDVSARKRAEDILRRQAEELAALQDTVLDLTATHDLNTLLQTIVERAVGLLKATGGALFLYDAERQEARCVVSYNTSDAYVGMVKKLGEAPSGAIVAAGRGLIADAHVVWAGRHSLQLAPTSVASTPMTWQGRVTGVIDVLDNRPSRRFAPADLELLTLFANHAAIAVENTRLYESERQARKLAETLRAANVALTRSLDLEVVLETLLDCLAELVPYDSANVMLLEPGGRLVIRALRGYECWSDPDAIRAVTLARDTPIIETLLNRTEGIVIADTLAEPGWDPIPDSVHVRNWMGVPVIAGGRVIGLYSLDKTVPGFFTDEHRRLVEALAAQAAVAIQNAQLFEHVRRSQAWLQRVTQRVVSAEEEERHRIARELHDDVLNEMAVLAMDQEWRTIPARLQERYHALTLRTRQITAALRPPMLAKGLDGALEDLVAEFDQRVGGQPRVRLYVFDREVRYPPHVEAHLFRIVQQAAENALRHGHPRTIAIYAHLGASRVRITVEDDGMGFDTGAGLDLADLVTSKHLGLASMYERAVLIGATVHIDSVPGAGTRVQVRWDAGGSAEA